MQSIICRGCCSQLEGIERAKNIFVSELILESGSIDNKQKQSDSPVSKIMTISSGLELISGYSISKTDGISPYMCNECTEKLTTYVNFRKQLFRSYKLLKNFDVLPSTCNDIVERFQVDTSNSDTLSKKLDKPEHTNRELIDSTENGNLDIFQQQQSPDNINVDDNSRSPNFASSVKTEYNTRTTRDLNQQDNNNLNDSELSNLSVDIHVCEENDFKHQVHDIESDIDVCSGEDDDILELDVPNRRNEPIEISSSSESEIEVCDNNRGEYLPINKCVG